MKLDRNLTQKSLQKILDENIHKNSKTWDEYEKKTNPQSLEDWKEMCANVLDCFYNEIHSYENFLSACNIVVDEIEKKGTSYILNIIAADTDHQGNYNSDLLLKFKIALSHITMETAPVLYHNIATELSNRIAESTITSATFYTFLGENIYNQILEAAMFVDEAKKEAKTISNLRLAFPEKSNISDDDLLTAFHNGDFDEELDDYTLEEYVSLKMSDKKLSDMMRIMCDNCPDLDTLSGLLPTLLSMQIETQNAVAAFLSKLVSVYGENDPAFIHLINEYNALGEKITSFYNNRQKDIKEEADFLYHYTLGIENLMQNAQAIIKKNHGSIGFRKVMQCDMEAADVEDMKNFDLTAQLFGKEKAQEMLIEIRKEVANYWGIPYDEELLNTPIDEWKDNPGR